MIATHKYCTTDDDEEWTVGQDLLHKTFEEWLLESNLLINS